ncbi:MAG TPA: hypothetical protein PK358_07785 [Spirochaetota bacterium]|nr:hypothetical protein [Spirochaetota bacterium]HPJ34720.1 hypothetical protein [Spirochaetota bacterium]
MTEKNRKKLKKWIFPIGIFILLFITEAIIGSGAALTYLYLDSKRGIERIEKYTVNYSMTLAEAFSRVAEFSYISKNYTSLNTLFHEKIEENTIDEAFFVLNDGKLIVHSNTTIEKGLKGNIANDEMAYNIDMILQPVTQKSRELFVSDYNIINERVPFNRDERQFLGKYLYKDINSSGWLFTKGIFIKGKPAGTVNFIISKNRIFGSIKESLARGKFMLIVVLVSAFFISIFISVIVMFRYHSIQKRAGAVLPAIKPEERFAPAISRPGITPVQSDEVIHASDVYFADDDLDGIPDEPFDEDIVEEEPAAFPVREAGEEPLPVLTAHKSEGEEEYVTIELLGEIEEEEARPELDITDSGRVYIAPVISIDTLKRKKEKEIKDAIPVHGRVRDVFH